ncbi:MAG TPA: hypothetical protein VNK24_01755 [Elusimicrobiota bacterium]|nr:hypothetical protein [Elusimicrobiota bacterium]
MKRRLSVVFVFGALIVQGAPFVMAYNRTAAVDYALNWYNTDVLNDRKANHINNSNETAKAYSPQVTGNYLWYYDGGSDYGSDLFGPVSYVSQAQPGIGRDCANFVSQALIDPTGGGLSLPDPDGAGGTVKSALRLGCELSGDSLGGLGDFFTSAASAPPYLSPGDVVVFQGIQG